MRTRCAKVLVGMTLAIGCFRAGVSQEEQESDGGLPRCLTFTNHKDYRIDGAGRELRDYQARAVIAHESGMQPDYGDLRFLDQDGVPLAHWIERFSAIDATVWIKLPLLPVAGTTIRMFFGNSCVASESDFDQTFPWQTELIDPEDAQHTSIVVDDQDRPRISYRNKVNKTLKYASWNGTSWEVEVVDGSSNTGSHTSLQLDRRSFPHIGYYDVDNATVKYARWDGSSWTIQAVETGTADYGAYTSLALDANDYPHLAYRQPGSRALKYATWDGNAWDIQVVDPACTTGDNLKLAADGHPHIAYNWCNGDLKFSQWDGARWRTTPVDVASDYAALIFDANDNPVIAYYDLCNGMKCSAFDGTSWRISVLEETKNCGYFLGLVQDAVGARHVSYQGFREMPNLTYAKFSDNAWRREIVDAEGDTGHDSSIALDSFGFPHLSYETKGVGLKHAYRRKAAIPEPSISPVEERRTDQ